MKAFGIIGKPVGHSKSPAIMNAAFKALNYNARYFFIAAKDLKDSIQLIRQFKFSGVNITAPYKEKITTYTNEQSVEAQDIAAINTILLKNKKFFGHNTDFLGVSGTLHSKGIDLKKKRILIIGAGGAARAVLFALKKESPQISIINRSPEKAELLAKKMQISYYPWQNLDKTIPNHEIIINTIPAVQIPFNVNVLTKEQVVFDANYHHSPLKEICKERNILFIDGKSWLLNQAYPAFKLFTGLDAPKEITEQAINHDTKWEMADIINLTSNNHSINSLTLNKNIVYYDKSENYKPSYKSNNLVIGLCDKTTIIPNLKIFDMFVFIEGLNSDQIINLLNEETDFSIEY